MSSFFYQTLLERLSQDQGRYPLLKLKELIDFSSVGYLLRSHKQQCRGDACGKKSNPLNMFEAILLYQWHSLLSWLQYNRDLLTSRGYTDGIMHIASHNRAFEDWLLSRNQAIKFSRYVIEQYFGTLKRRFGFRRASYFSQEKAKAQSFLKAMCHNLLKAINKVNSA